MFKERMNEGRAIIDFGERCVDSRFQLSPSNLPQAKKCVFQGQAHTCVPRPFIECLGGEFHAVIYSD